MENKPFLQSLFDFSFASFITPRFIRFLFILGLVLSALAALGVIISGFANGIAAGIIALIFSPVIFVLYVLFIRVTLEIIMVLFRILANIEKIAEDKKQ